MKPQEIMDFRIQHKMTEKEFAEFLGVTWQAVRLWETGQRSLSETNARLLRLFKRHPNLMKEF
ncbi:MAG: helix-turn-helix domain-containing protein [Bdellovibrio sp.]